MELITATLVLILCFYLMAKVVDGIFIKSLDNIADYLKLTPSVAGATLMALGTSAPEISTTMFALFLTGANPATGLGTVVGSAIFQILVVIGFAAIVKTSYLDWKPVLRDGTFYALTILILILVVADNTVSFAEASVLVGTYFLYLVVLFAWSRYFKESDTPDPISTVEKEFDPVENIKPKRGRPRAVRTVFDWLGKAFSPVNKLVDRILALLPDPNRNKTATLPIFVFSLVLIGIFSYFLVISAEALALGLGVPSAIVALTILAGGTSIPEMIGSAVVSREGRGDMAISNAVGSNIFDILMSLGLPLLIFTGVNGTLTDVGGENITSSILLLFATVIAVLGVLASQRFKIGRTVGFVLIAAYVVYVIAAYSVL